MDKYHKIEYLETENAKLLKDILERQLHDKGLSSKDNKKNKHLLSITRDNYGPKEVIAQAINWYRDSAKEYEDIKGALCSGELRTVSSFILDIEKWRLNQYILERHLKRMGSLDVGQLLAEDGLKCEELGGLIKKLDTPQVLAYQIAYENVTKRKNIVWFEDIKKALDYVENFLTISLKEKEIKHIRKKEFREEIEKKEIIIPQIYKDKKELPVHEKYADNKNIKYMAKKINAVEIPIAKKSNESITPCEFAIKYKIDDNSFEGKHPIISKDEIERTLTMEGMYDKEDLRRVIRKIAQSHQFSSVLKINGSENFSLFKIMQFGKEYSKEREKLFEDMDKF